MTIIIGETNGFAEYRNIPDDQIIEPTIHATHDLKWTMTGLKPGYFLMNLPLESKTFEAWVTPQLPEGLRMEYVGVYPSSIHGATGSHVYCLKTL